MHCGELLRFDAETGSAGDSVQIGGNRYAFRLDELAPGRFVIRSEKGATPARVSRDKDRVRVWMAGRVAEFSVPSIDHSTLAGSSHSQDHVRAPMPGTLVKLLVSKGDPVTENQIVAVVEAMKMEHPLRAPRDGSVEDVFGIPGQIVDADAVVVSLVSQES